MEFCEWSISKLNENGNILSKILFTNEENFTSLEKLISKTYNTVGMLITSAAKMQGAGKLIVWVRI